MAQPTTTSGYATNVAASYRPVGFGVLVAWQRVFAANVNFFTVGSSLIGSGDIIKSGGSSVTFFDKYQYTDYSIYIMSWSVARMLGQYPYGVILAQADVQFDNTSRLFLPGFDPTIGSGILPNRPLKVSASINSESLMQFTGFTGEPDVSLTGHTMSVHAFDVMDYLQKYSFTTSGATTSGLAGTTTSGYLVNVRVDQAIAYYLGQLGFSGSQYVLDQGLSSPIGYLPVADRKLGDVFNDLIQVEQGLLFADENGLPRFWNRQHFNTLSGTQAYALTYNNMAEVDYQNTPIINDVSVVANPRAVAGSQKIWEQSSSINVQPGQYLDVFANFSDDSGSLPVTEVDTPLPITSSTSSTYAANSASDGSGTDMSSILQIVGVYLFGTSYKMTFYNPTANTIFLTGSDGYPAAITLFGTPAKVVTQINQRYLDQVSIDAYGRNPANNGDPIEIDNDYIQDIGTAYSLAYTLVNEYKDPRRRYTVKVYPRPELQIGDYGTITITDSNETKSTWIVGNTIGMDNQGNFTQTLQLEERSIKSYFTIGTSPIGGSDQIAP